jgi:hypothetical protein
MVMSVCALTRYHRYAFSAASHQNRDIHRIAGENVVQIFSNEHERGINRIRGLGYRQQRTRCATYLLVNRQHLKNLQEARKISLPTTAPNLRYDNSAGAKRTTINLSYPQFRHQRAVVVFHRNECPGI